MIRGEARVLEGLFSLGLKGESQSRLLRLPVHPLDDGCALDIRHPAITVSARHTDPAPHTGIGL